ncbi:MAG: invasin domain 3-containing protein, partial [Bacteroidales bacterium]
MKSQSLLLKRSFILFLALVAMLVTSKANAATTYYSRLSGNWNVNTTWSNSSGGSPVGLGVYPVAGDIVYIERGFTVTVTANAACATLTLGNTAVGFQGYLIINSNQTLTVSGATQVGNTNGGTGAPAVVSGLITFNSASVFDAQGALTIGISTYRQGSINMTNGGTLKIGSTFTIFSLGTYTPGSGTVEYYKAGDQTVATKTKLGYNYNNLILSGSGVKTVSDVYVDGIISMQGTATTAASGNNNGIIANTNTSLIYAGSGPQTTGAEFGKPDGNAVRAFTGAGGVTINNSAGVSLGTDVSISGILNLTSGNFNIGANRITLKGPSIAGAGNEDNLISTTDSWLSFDNSINNLFVPHSITTLSSLEFISGSINTLTLHNDINCSNLSIAGKIITGNNTVTPFLPNTLTAVSTNGTYDDNAYVYGRLGHSFAGGQDLFSFPIGDANYYTPVDVTFDQGSSGNLVVSTTPGLHPNKSTAGLKVATILNRYWTIENSGITACIYSAAFYFVSGDIPGGANPLNYIVRKHNLSGWQSTGGGFHNNLSTQGTGITTFSEYILGEGVPDATKSELTVTPSSIVADGIAYAVLTVTAKDIDGNILGGGGATVTITKSGGDGTLTSVTDNHDGTYTAYVSWTALSHGDFVATLNSNPVKNGGASQTQVTVNYIVGPPSGTMSTLTPSSSTIIANGTSTQVLTVTAYDSQGRRINVGGAVVYLYWNSGSGIANIGTYTGTSYPNGDGTFTYIGSFTDNGDGTYTTTVTSPIHSGQDVFSASINYLDITHNVGGNPVITLATINYIAGPLDHFVLSLDPCQTNGVAFTGTNTLTAYDINNNVCLAFNPSTNTVTFT